MVAACADTGFAITTDANNAAMIAIDVATRLRCIACSLVSGLSGRVIHVHPSGGPCSIRDRQPLTVLSDRAVPLTGLQVAYLLSVARHDRGGHLEVPVIAVPT